ncbi:copper amine oxidase N-terminal domain-containing protein [Paenibacillus sp. N3.4]|uniref:copper amine oxidase N-terminal domain-containing protein n=1 Tax=Paenibacillus sp. N3.4 TaxID=2603222 RepID=UPI0011C73B1E|nr:copper amine oxidase N-terminal domain-containing protein [Paenibacillus sp. N3.4]TXK76561.1 copper amine oxidase N-terminal domain-containing protein [Paenibacillus sp. N3.4]
MATVSGPGVEKVSLDEASLEDESGRQVALLKNEPSKDDHLDKQVIMMPVKPLEQDMTYRAQIKLTATMSDGTRRAFSKDWTFRTEPIQGIGVTKLHKDAAAYALQMGNLDLNRQHSVRFGLTDHIYYVDTIPFLMKQEPLIVVGTSFLYIRDLAAALGASVSWDDSQKAAVYKKKDKEIVFYNNQNAYSLNGENYSTDSGAN